MKAKTYIYRNLNAGGFSSKYRGKVTDRFGSDHENAMVCFATVNGFQVSEKVRDKIRATGKKQVHAYITVDMTMSSTGGQHLTALESYAMVKYNPKTDDNFYVTDGTPLDQVKLVAFYKDKVYHIDKISDPDLKEFVNEMIGAFHDVHSKAAGSL